MNLHFYFPLLFVFYYGKKRIITNLIYLNTELTEKNRYFLWERSQAMGTFP